MAKRLICVIISVLMIISLLPTGAFATEDTGEAVLAVSENENVEETEEANEEVNEEETEEVTVSEAAQAVQAAIDALPTVDEVAAMDTEGQNEVYYQASAIWDAYYELTEADQAEIDLTALETLADYFNGLIMVATDTFQIGETVYASWSDAISAASDGDTITLLRSVTYSSSSVLTVTAGKNVTLDLNGYTLSKTYSGTSTSSLITNNGTLTIVDSSVAQTGTISVIASNTSTISSATVFLAAIRNAGTLNLNGGTIKASTSSTSSKMKLWCVVNTTSGASTTLDGASVVVDKTSTYYTSYGIYNNADNTSIYIKSGTISVSSPASASTAAVGTNTSCSNSSITMSGGELTVECTRDSSIAVAYYGIIAESGSTTITGGSISVSSTGGAYAVKGNEDSTAEISNLTATVSTTTTSSSASYYLFTYANVNSGTYTMTDADNLSASVGTTALGVTIYGGTYSEDLNSSVEACLAEGYESTSNGDGTYTVSADTTVYVAQNTTTTTKYETLADAISSAGSGDTIQLLDNVELSSQITISSTVTLDLNGYTVSYPNNGDYGSVFYVNGSLTITDSSEGGTGAITTSGNNEFYAINVNISGSLTVNKGTITSSNSDGNSGACGIGAQSNSTVVVSGGSISGSKHGLSASNSTITVSGDSTIQSTGSTDTHYGVNLSGGATLTVNSGEISGYTAGVYVGSSSTVTVNGGTLSGTGTSENNGSGLYSFGGNVNVNGGTITGYYGIYTNSSTSTISISGGSITGSGYYGIYLKGTSDVTLNGGSITGAKHGVYVYNSSVTITVPESSTVTVKGTETSALALKVASNYSPTISIAGGHYSTAVETAYCADGYEPYTETSGDYYDDGLQYTVKSTSFTLGIYGSSTTVPAEIVSGDGESVMYVKVASTYIGTDGYYSTTAYPTTSQTYTVSSSVDSGSYIFAGWYSAETAEDGTTTYTALTEFPEDTDAYAKFVDANVLTVKAQVTSGTTASSSTTNMRFVSTVDSLDYSKVGFKFTINSKESDKSTTTVYKTIVASTAGDSFSYPPSYFSTSSEYFFTFTITGIPTSAFSTEITVIPYWVTADGTTVYGTTKTVTVSDGLTAGE